MTAKNIAHALGGATPAGTAWKARCPVHDDKTPSLSITDQNGKILVHCHAGCSQTTVLNALRELGLLASASDTPKAQKTRNYIQKIYDYNGPDGRLIFQVVRSHPKKFRQRRPDGNGGWIWNLNGVWRVPYRLPDLLATDAETIFIVEGEKDADLLSELGLTATCNSGGAGKWREEYNPYFQGKKVAIIPDNDAPGHAQAKSVAAALYGIAAQVKVLELAGLKAKGDVSDWVAEGGTPAELMRIYEATTEWQIDVECVNSNGPSHTGSGMLHNARNGSEEPLCFKPSAPLVTARAFLENRYSRDGDQTFYFIDGTCCRWNGRCYERVDRNTIRAEVYEFLENSVRWNADKQVPFDPTSQKVNDVVDALHAAANLPANTPVPSWLTDEYIPDVTLRPDELLALNNGLLHLPTLELHTPTPLFFSFSALDYDYEPNVGAQPLGWINFLTQIWPDDRESIDTLQEIFGYFLTADTSQQKIFMVVGPKRSGKGTIARVLTRLLGQSNVCAPTLASLSDRFGLAPLIDKQAAIIADARLGMRSDQTVIGERLLSISGEDCITVDRKHISPWTGSLPTRFLLLTNELPRFSDASGALASRLIILTLTESYYGREDPELTQRLLNELPAILNWAIEGWIRLRNRGYFVQPAASQDLVQELEDLASPIMTFIRERCVLGANEEVACDDLYEEYKRWCDAQGRKHPAAKSNFGRDLRAAIPRLKIVQHDTNEKKGQRFYRGLALA